MIVDEFVAHARRVDLRDRGEFAAAGLGDAARAATAREDLQNSWLILGPIAHSNAGWMPVSKPRIRLLMRVASPA